MLRVCLLVKCVEPCTQNFNVITFINSKIGCRCITASQSMRSQRIGNTCKILLVFSYIAWISITVQSWIGDIIMTWFFSSPLCLKCTYMIKIMVPFATTIYALYRSSWYICCLMFVLASSCFVLYHLVTKICLFLSALVHSLSQQLRVKPCRLCWWDLWLNSITIFRMYIVELKKSGPDNASKPRSLLLLTWLRHPLGTRKQLSSVTPPVGHFILTCYAQVYCKSLPEARIKLGLPKWVKHW